MTRPLVPEDYSYSAQAERSRALDCIARAVVLKARAQISGTPIKSANDRAVDLILRAATEPTSTGDAEGLMQIAYRFVESLVPVSASAAVIARSLQVDLGHNLSVSIPSLTLPLAGWVGEGKAIPVLNGSTAPGAKVEPLKIATLVVLTGEMIRGSNAERLVRQVLLENVSGSLDHALFNANAGVSGLSPPGLLAGVPPLTAGASMTEDVAAIAKALAPTAGASPPILICAPAQYVALRMLAFADPMQVLMSNALPDGTIVGVTPAALATAISGPRIEPSQDAELVLNDQPGEVVDIGGLFAAPIGSVFQADSVAIKFVLPASWSLRSASAVAWIENVAW